MAKRIISDLAFLVAVAVCFFSAVERCSAGSVAASCSATWTFPTMSCSSVASKLTTQINAWSGSECPSTCATCCYYSLTGTSTTDSTTTITSRHEIVGHTSFSSYTLYQDLTFTLTSSNGGEGCAASGHSVQETFYIVQDGGQDYCNLKNLILGSGLSVVSGMTESVSSNTCTDLSKANCTG